MIPLVLQDKQSGATARILPELGYNCYSFEARVAGQIVDVLDTDPGFESGEVRPTKGGIPLLVQSYEPLVANVERVASSRQISSCVLRPSSCERV